ncbi:MAG: hypothetical protein WC721_02195 [Victivallaceae bacterium]|jgi:hypothetical protein
MGTGKSEAIENYKTGKRIFKRKLRRSEILIAGKWKMINMGTIA